VFRYEVTRMPTRIAVTTGNSLEGYEIAEYLGVVRGIVVRAQTIGQGIRGAFSSIFGGNIKAYEEVCEQARSEAFQRMVQHAEERGADAVIAMRYDATEFSSGVTEVLAYGTAVKLHEPSHGGGEGIQRRGV
jgi:uncharacterized protein YbjQ (UPF0145 family)